MRSLYNLGLYMSIILGTLAKKYGHLDGHVDDYDYDDD